jgi:hypothetical protein
MNKGNLLVQVFSACQDFTGKRLAVVWRTALNDIGDEDAIPLHPYRRQQLLQELPGSTDKRPALLVFIEPRGFPDEHNGSIGWTLTGHSPYPAAAEVTRGAGLDTAVKPVE